MAFFNKVKAIYAHLLAKKHNHATKFRVSTDRILRATSGGRCSGKNSFFILKKAFVLIFLKVYIVATTFGAFQSFYCYERITLFDLHRAAR